MVNSSAFHPYTRPTVANPIQDVSIDESISFLFSAEALLALAQLQDSSKLFQIGESTKQISPPIPAPVLTPNPVNSPVSAPEQPLQSPTEHVPNEKSRRKRTTFSPEQASRLESEYLSDSYMAREKRLLLAHSLNLSENQVKTWFQNRRAKDKRDRKIENSSNNTHSRKSSPSRKSSSDSSPTPSLMTTSTPFVLSSHQIQTATSPTTIESILLPTTPPASIIQKVEQFPNPNNQQLIPNFEALLQSLSNPNSQYPPQIQSLLDSSPPPLFNPNILINFQSPLQSAII